MRKKRAVPIKTKPTFAVVVDGDCEVWYLQMLKRNERSLFVNIEPKIPQKKSITEQFEKVQELQETFTKVFWIIDLDVILSETRQAKKGTKTPLHFFIEYRKKLNNKNIVIVVNNPCIEFWLLLHFDTTAKYFNNCETVEKQLKKHLTNYEKSKIFYTKQDNDIYQKLKPYLNKAILNAKKLNRFNVDTPHNSMSEMQLFFESSEFGSLFKDK